MFLLLIMLGLLISECLRDQIILFVIRSNPNLASVFCFALNFSRIISWTFFLVLCPFISCSNYTGCSPYVPCVCVRKNVPHWLPVILIILSNDIDLNPGPHFHNNSLTKYNFQRVHFIEAHKSIFNYDLISICEISLNDSVELSETPLNNYTFVPANHPANTRRGGAFLSTKLN